MTLEKILELLRGRIDDPENVDHPEDNLWLNEELCFYLDEAQEEIARRVECLFSYGSTANLSQFAVSAGQGVVALNARTLWIDKAWWDGEELSAGQYDQIELYYPDFRTKQGNVEAYTVEKDRLLLAYIPDAQGSLTAHVCHLPLNAFDAAGDMSAQTPEVPAQWHMHMIDYACHLAYLKNDEQTYDPRASERHLAIFDRNVGRKKSAKMEEFKRNYMPKRARYPRL